MSALTGPILPRRDLALYYADLERLLGVHGRTGAPADARRRLPEPRLDIPAEVVFKEWVEKQFGDRRVIISRGIHAGWSSRQGGELFSKISSTATTLRAAEATGRFTLRTNAVVARITTEPDGSRATGVELVDAITGASEEIRARVVVLCASTIESLRILMNSRGRAHPQGIGASSGVLGHYLMDHSAGNVYFYMPDVRDDGGKPSLCGSDSIT